MDRSKLNSCMLFKLRSGELCVMMTRRTTEPQYDFFEVLYDYDNIINNRIGGVINLTDIGEDLKPLEKTHKDDDEYDIIAIKQFNSTLEPLNHVLEDKEPENWDWERKEEFCINSDLDKEYENKFIINISINTDKSVSKETNEERMRNELKKQIDYWMEELDRRR